MTPLFAAIALITLGELRVKSLENTDKVLELMLGEQQRTYKTAALSQTIYNRNQALIDFANQYGYFSPTQPLVATVTRSEEDLDLTLELLDAVSGLARDEVLAKVLAYRDLKEGQQVDQYVVDKVFNLWQGMPAYGLVSNTEALLLFRGTDLSLYTLRSLASILSDVDVKGVGLSVFKHSQAEIHAWLKKVKKARVMGFSLGGVLAIYTALYEKEYVTDTIAFSPPGLSRQIFAQWKEANPSLQVYVTRGDFISKVGRLVGRVQELSIDKQMAPLEAHTTLMTAQPIYFLSSVNVDAENQSR